MPLLYTPDRELDPPDTEDVVELERCELCLDYFEPKDLDLYNGKWTCKECKEILINTKN